MSRRPLRVLFSVPTFNAGETTRGIELAKAVAASAKAQGRPVDIRFLSSYDESVGFCDRVRAAGFDMEATQFAISRDQIRAFMAADHKVEEFVSDPGFAKDVMDGILAKVSDGGFDLIIHGFSPVVGMAAKIAHKPAISFTPFPTDNDWVRSHMVKDVPDVIENALTLRLPRPLRKALARLAGQTLVERPFFTQPTLAQAGADAGWQSADTGLCAMLAQECQLVCDLPDFYVGQRLPAGCQVIGPLFSVPASARVDPAIERLFAPDAKGGAGTKVFVAMGSSAEKEYILEAARALLTGEFRTLLVTSKETCPIEEILALGPVPENCYVTDSFIPSHIVAPMADVAVVHGGQGTVQTAITAGVPLAGVAMQPEQQANLDNIVEQGAGLRIPKKFWHAARIRRAVATLSEKPEFRTQARRLMASIARIDTRANAMKILWEYVAAKGL